MRVGTRVKLQAYDVIGGYRYGRIGEDGQFIPDDRTGTVMESNRDEIDDQEEVATVAVRWDDGRIETGISENDLTDVTPRLFVNVYDQDRAYGGPEEGGWWYTTCSPVHDECQIAESADHAMKLLEETQARLDGENEGRPPISSVASRGRLVVFLESFPPEHSPRQRPHYC